MKLYATVTSRSGFLFWEPLFMPSTGFCLLSIKEFGKYESKTDILSLRYWAAKTKVQNRTLKVIVSYVLNTVIPVFGLPSDYHTLNYIGELPL